VNYDNIGARRWNDIPWKERSILDKIGYVVMCLIGGLFTCFLCLVVLALVWGLILNVFGD
jgi:hypothetical protein